MPIVTKPQVGVQLLGGEVAFDEFTPHAAPSRCPINHEAAAGDVLARTRSVRVHVGGAQDLTVGVGHQGASRWGVTHMDRALSSVMAGSYGKVSCSTTMSRRIGQIWAQSGSSNALICSIQATKQVAPAEPFHFRSHDHPPRARRRAAVDLRRTGRTTVRRVKAEDRPWWCQRCGLPVAGRWVTLIPAAEGQPGQLARRHRVGHGVRKGSVTGCRRQQLSAAAGPPHQRRP